MSKIELNANEKLNLASKFKPDLDYSQMALISSKAQIVKLIALVSSQDERHV